ncbi:hypothetical protein LZ31DRAFT_178469 [Colletotrichum somersetense]|nr:hypothetical protein LZ31DRAFT_178469 [Colletotrichum somersetense]
MTVDCRACSRRVCRLSEGCSWLCCGKGVEFHEDARSGDGIGRTGRHSHPPATAAYVRSTGNAHSFTKRPYTPPGHVGTSLHCRRRSQLQGTEQPRTRAQNTSRHQFGQWACDRVLRPVPREGRQARLFYVDSAHTHTRSRPRNPAGRLVTSFPHSHSMQGPFAQKPEVRLVFQSLSSFCAAAHVGTVDLCMPIPRSQIIAQSAILNWIASACRWEPTPH